jgi:hypothetical protein
MIKNKTDHFRKEVDLAPLIDVTILSRTECCLEKVKSFSLELGKKEAIKGERLWIDFEADWWMLRGFVSSGDSAPRICTA